MCRSDINFPLVRSVDLTFVYRGHRCKDFCYSWQKMKRQHCSQLNTNLPSWAADRIAAVSCITNPVHRGEKKDKRLKNHIQNFYLIIGPGWVMKKGCQQLNSTGLDAVLAPKESQIAGLGFSWWSCLWSECLQKLQWEKRASVERSDFAL